ncbi:unnamed protein product [Sphagnum balticum]
MPSRNRQELQLSHMLRQTLDTAAGPVTVPIHHITIKQVFSSNRTVVISPSSPVCISCPRQGKYAIRDVVAVRVPLLHLTNFHHADWPDSNKQPFALMVLMLPSDSAQRWHVYELELVEVVAEQNVQLDMARREAETAICAWNDFLAVMNHEMWTPMHAIIALSSLLQVTELMLEQRSMVDTILKSSNLLATLINDVLDLSHLEDGSLELEMNTFKLLQIFIDVKDQHLLVMQPKQISAFFSKEFSETDSFTEEAASSVNLSPDLPGFVAGDDKRLMQMALNVVGNAVKFMKEGSISIKVQDTGVGLNPQDIPKLFNKFLQADSTTTRNYSGTGLGLAICKRVNEMVTRGLLMHLGCEVTVVSSSQECLQVISQPGQSFNVLLLDVCMPDMDGYEVAIHQEKFARHERPLLIALTANTDMATWEWCLSLGMDQVILKPISLEKMWMVLTELLGFGSLNDNHWRT